MKRDLAQAGRPLTAQIPLETEYDRSYGSAIDALRASKSSADVRGLESAGEIAGLEAVRRGLESGKVVTSAGETYSEYYGSAWDERHRGAAPPPSGARAGGR